MTPCSLDLASRYLVPASSVATATPMQRNRAQSNARRRFNMVKRLELCWLLVRGFFGVRVRPPVPYRHNQSQ